MTHARPDSLWQVSCLERFTAPVFAGDAAADLVIIGGGYTGCSAALHAAEYGASVYVLEGQTIGHGGSGRNVGLCNAGLWLPPDDIEARVGQEAGAHLVSVLSQAPDLVFSLIESHQIECEAVRSGTLHCGHAPGAMSDLRKRYDQLQRRGAPVELLNRDEAVLRVGSQSVHGALFDPRAGTIQPLAYVRGLARAAVAAGAHLHEKSPALKVARKGSAWVVETAKGRIRAKAILLATNGYNVPIKGLPNPALVPVHYFQGATPPLPSDVLDSILPGLEGCWDTALVMSSWRRDGRGRLIVGAMGNPEHLAGGVHRAWLQRKLGALFPELAKTELAPIWSGRIAMTAEYMPKILEFGPKAMAVFGYSGRGIGPGTVFGKAAALSLIGDKTALPIPQVTAHSLPMAGLRGAYYETGAVLNHAFRNRI
ncbi:NAD(P)/FAD-dependent oxidoreductase [Pseudoprimorskyibacter insulae]|uniref:Gamma-glutamylputrescine oxidoreductase n=1 Tax=Pseudoprimorskyibacter insulae TaxID=1695997 RepID=A0A2R8AQ77_9RHOB|nr:FAD-binding oxidoreductase [Pseudoprimorskyibacter insulae]SPF78130.1 Gamma-glutamylputrescine oxidoreductase [Pseudoprimorskyibacter insulae]